MYFRFLYYHSQWFVFVDSNIYHQAHAHMSFFLTMTDTITSQIIDISF